MFPVLYKIYTDTPIWYFGYTDGVVLEMKGRKYMACYSTNNNNGYFPPTYSPIVVKFTDFNTDNVESNVKNNIII